MQQLGESQHRIGGDPDTLLQAAKAVLPEGAHKANSVNRMLVWDVENNHAPVSIPGSCPMFGGMDSAGRKPASFLGEPDEASVGAEAGTFKELAFVQAFDPTQHTPAPGP
jgi:hypothetical protein